MHSFKLTAIGNLAKTPELGPRGEITYTRFCLVGNDFAGEGKEEVTTSVWFVAFNALGEAIAKHARTGDQLIVEAHLRANTWTDKDQEVHYDVSYIVDGFRFGAPGKQKRQELSQRG